MNARSERQVEPLLDAAHYQRLIGELAAAGRLSGVAIVGDEPLLPEAWEVSRAVLDAAAEQGLASALITNGTWLDVRAEELAHRSSQILLSLDGIGAEHDATRRTAGAYAAIERGLDVAAALPALRERITVTSVVQPDKYQQLDAIPAVLQRYGLRRWALSPQIQFRRTKPARLHPRLFPALYDELPRLIALGRAAGIEVMIDDSLSLLLQADREGQLRDAPVERPVTPDIRVLRMRPDGLTVRYTDLLSTDTSKGVRWDGVESPVAFYRRLYAANPDPIAA